MYTVYQFNQLYMSLWWRTVHTNKKHCDNTRVQKEENAFKFKKDPLLLSWKSLLMHTPCKPINVNKSSLYIQWRHHVIDTELCLYLMCSYFWPSSHKHFFLTNFYSLVLTLFLSVWTMVACDGHLYFFDTHFQNNSYSEHMLIINTKKSGVKYSFHMHTSTKDMKI